METDLMLFPGKSFVRGHIMGARIWESRVHFSEEGEDYSY